MAGYGVRICWSWKIRRCDTLVSLLLSPLFPLTLVSHPYLSYPLPPHQPITRPPPKTHTTTPLQHVHTTPSPETFYFPKEISMVVRLKFFFWVEGKCGGEREVRGVREGDGNGGGWSSLLNSPTAIQQSFYFSKDYRTLPAERDRKE